MATPILPMKKVEWSREEKLGSAVSITNKAARLD
jgi:hypothetical protein